MFFFSFPFLWEQYQSSLREKGTAGVWQRPQSCTQGTLLCDPSSWTQGFTLVPPRTLIHGDKKGGFTIFWADDGLDTGDLLLQKECEVLPDDTVSTLYNRFLFPEGIKGMVRDGS
jgi:hypothetical protein